MHMWWFKPWLVSLLSYSRVCPGQGTCAPLCSNNEHWAWSPSCVDECVFWEKVAEIWSVLVQHQRDEAVCKVSLHRVYYAIGCVFWCTTSMSWSQVNKLTAKFTWNQLVCMHEFSSQKQQKTPANQLISGKFCSFTVVLVLLFQVYEYLILYIYSMLFVIILSCRAHILHVPQHNYWQVAMHVWILFVVFMEWEGRGNITININNDKEP